MFLVHGYDDVKDGVVWHAATNSVERLVWVLERVAPHDPDGLRR